MQTEQERIAQWKPLEDLAARRPQIEPRMFMFMGMAGEIYLFKHLNTRRYLNVHPNGNTFFYDGQTGNYYRVSNLTAINHALGRS